MEYSKGKIRVKEESIHKQVVNYLRWQYPKIIFRTDFSAGVKMTIGQAVKHKSLQHSRAFPDLQILFPAKGLHGLFIELKKPGTKITKRNGDYASEHLQEQAETLTRLKGLGYAACFCIGFDEAKDVIDDYLKGSVQLITKPKEEAA